MHDSSVNRDPSLDAASNDAGASESAAAQDHLLREGSLTAAELDHLLKLDHDGPEADDITREVDVGTSDDLQRAARGLHFIQRVQDENPHLVDDLAAASESQWLHVEGERPTRIGRHQILRRLGSGGFGVVFLAFDPELEREVALKVPRVETLINGQTRRRFLRESKTAARLNHANIATIFEAGTVGPIFYIAAEYCPGGSLDDYMRDPELATTLPPRAAAALIAAIADAVDHAHQRGVLHRDIKPSNILLDLPSEDRKQLCDQENRWGEVAKLVDFGLAKNVQAGEEETKSGIMLGTPAYTAPEMVLDRSTTGPTADVYSLGATLYYALTGEPPLKKATDFETLLAAQREDPLPPSRVRPTTPRDLDAICLKCLEKNPARRYVSAAELAGDLRRFLNHQPILARRTTRLETAGRWITRNPVFAALAAASVILLLVAGVTTASLWRIYRNQSAISAQLESRRDAMNIRRLTEQSRSQALLALTQPWSPEGPMALDYSGDGNALLLSSEALGCDRVDASSLQATDHWSFSAVPHYLPTGKHFLALLQRSPTDCEIARVPLAGQQTAATLWQLPSKVDRPIPPARVAFAENRWFLCPDGREVIAGSDVAGEPQWRQSFESPVLALTYTERTRLLAVATEKTAASGANRYVANLAAPRRPGSTTNDV